MNIIIIARANMTAATNAWIHNNLDKTGGDNITVPLIGLTDPDDAEPTHYGCNYAVGDEPTADRLRNGVINSPHVSLYTNRNFWEVVEELGLRKKPGDPIG